MDVIEMPSGILWIRTASNTTDQPGAEGKSIEQTVQRNPEKSGDSHLVDITAPFLAGMNEDEALHHENQQKSHQNRPADGLSQNVADLGQHMQEHRPEENSGAEAEQKS